MTMAEIDRLRLSDEEVTRLRELSVKFYLLGDPEFWEWRALKIRRAQVDSALREWWAQGCREVAP